MPLGAPVAVVPIGSVTNSPVTPATGVRAAGELVVPVVVAPVVLVAVVPVDVVAKEPGTLVVAVVLVRDPTGLALRGGYSGLVSRNS